VTRTHRQIEENRKGDAIIQVRDEAGCPGAGLSVWVEQESHEFLFGCVVADLGALSDSERTRYRARQEEVFNQLGAPADGRRGDVKARVRLGNLRRELDRLAEGGLPLDVHVGGQTVGLNEFDEQEGARRVADLYTLCFAHPSVRGVFWHGFRDGEPDAEGGGLLRHDLSPKPAHRVLQKLVAVIWHTRSAGQTDAEGCFAFRGFYGTYRAAVFAGDQAAKVISLPLHRRPGVLSAPYQVDLGRCN
jgi:endo-1,4-beta-xylanase